MGTHLRVLSESYPLNTNMTGLDGLPKYLLPCALAESSLSIERVNHLTNMVQLSICCHHGLSQQGVWVPFWTPKPLKSTPQDTQIILCGISKNLNLQLIIQFFHLPIIPMTLFNDIMPYSDEFIHVYD